VMKITGCQASHGGTEGESPSCSVDPVLESTSSSVGSGEGDGDNPPLAVWLGGGCLRHPPTSMRRSSSGKPRPSGRA
jgi:hypothetical protein